MLELLCCHLASVTCTLHVFRAGVTHQKPGSLERPFHPAIRHSEKSLGDHLDI